MDDDKSKVPIGLLFKSKGSYRKMVTIFCFEEKKLQGVS